LGVVRVHSNFLDLPSRESAYESARYVVLPIPYDSATSYRSGSREGPRAILDASAHIETFDEELLKDFASCGIATAEAAQANLDGPEAMQGDIFEAARSIVRDGKMVVGFGGDHSVTGGLVRAVMSRHRKVSVLQIDAHPDLFDTLQQSRHSHATVMRRCHEMGATIVPVGIRCVGVEEHGYMKRHGIEAVSARACREAGDWQDRVMEGLGEKVYITFDIDGFDPAYAPGTGTPEPGGLDWYQVTSLVRRVAAEREVVGIDVVEVSPIAGQNVTEFLAGRLAYKTICYIESGLAGKPKAKGRRAR
jgi:agmatinase